MYERGKIKQIADKLNLKQNTLSERFRREGVKVMPHYTSMEIYMLENFHYTACAPFIKHKSLNALKIKQWRLTRSRLNLTHRQQ